LEPPLQDLSAAGVDNGIAAHPSFGLLAAQVQLPLGVEGDLVEHPKHSDLASAHPGHQRQDEHDDVAVQAMRVPAAVPGGQMTWNPFGQQEVADPAHALVVREAVRALGTTVWDLTIAEGTH